MQYFLFLTILLANSMIMRISKLTNSSKFDNRNSEDYQIGGISEDACVLFQGIGC